MQAKPSKAAPASSARQPRGRPAGKYPPRQPTVRRQRSTQGIATVIKAHKAPNSGKPPGWQPTIRRKAQEDTTTPESLDFNRQWGDVHGRSGIPRYIGYR